MALPAVLIAAQMGLQLYGQYRANQEQAAAEARNAAFLREQANFAERATQREMKLQEIQSKRLRGEQVVGFAQGGVDVGSGSALDFLVDQEASAIEERAAIRSEGDMRVRLASLRADAAQFTADTLSSGSYNTMQAATTILGGASQYASYQSGQQRANAKRG